MSKFNRMMPVLVLVLCGCGAGSGGMPSEDSFNKQTAGGGGQLFAVTPATEVDCSAGGSVYSIYVDANANLSLDDGETVLSRQVVCNGDRGQNGFSTLISLARVSTDLLACASGRGLQVNSGLDADGSLILEASEISQAQILCDGQDGAVGGAGPAGRDGMGMVFQTLAATPSVCPDGGSVLLMALDQGHTGVYSALYPGQQSVTLCNGRDGVGAEVPAYTPVEAIQPCGNGAADKEVLLRLQNGQVLASFSDDTKGTMTRLTFLPDGAFMATDGSGCTFSLATSGDGLTRSISWFNQVQMSWSMP